MTDPEGPTAGPPLNDDVSDAAFAQAGFIGAGGGLILVGAGWVFSVLEDGTEPWLLLIAALFALWFGVWRQLLRRSLGGRIFRVLNPCVVGLVPALFTALFVIGRGAERGLSAWAPPIFFTLIVTLSALRMRPLLPIGLGFVSATAYVGMWVAWIRPMIGPELAFHVDGPANIRFTVTRSFLMLVVSAASAAVAVALRRTVKRAIEADRARTLFGKYQLTEEIASGGMGTVSKATYCPAGGFVREVAIKRLHAHNASDPVFVAAFRAEAELCARLQHPNVVAVFDFGQVDNTYFLAMEYVDGWSLQELLRRARSARRPLPEVLVGQIGTEILNGLDYAHDRARGADGELLRVIHRDLSPGNILISRRGEVKIADFGIARTLRDTTAHQTDNVMGKLSYLAPEVAAGKPFDTRADLYATALILIELLTLESANRRQSETSTWKAVLQGGSPGIGRDDARPGWGKFFDRALARDPSHRFPSAREMKSALLQVVPPAELPHGDALGPLMKQVARPVVLGDSRAEARVTTTEPVTGNEAVANETGATEAAETEAAETEPIHSASTHLLDQDASSSG